jgi:LacI family transcriptional regulator
LKLIAGVGDGSDLVEEPSLFLSTLIRRASVSPPAGTETR